MSEPSDPSKPTEIIVEVVSSPEPPSPLIQTENALDELEETLTELAKHSPMPARLQRKVDLLVDKARDRIIHMRIDNPALKELMLIAQFTSVVRCRPTGRPKRSGSNLNC